MKTHIALISLAFLAAACAKEPSQQGSSGGDIEFSASLEEQLSKTELSGTKVLWVEEDAISILWDGGSTVAEAASAGAQTTFSATVDAADEYYAVYPASAAAAYSAGSLQITVPASQHGTFAEANIAVAKTTSDQKTFAFKNLCALGKITLERDDIAEIRFAGAGSEAIAGTVPVTLGADGVPSYGAGADGKEIVLTPASGATFAAGTYYFSVLPQSLDNGLSVTLSTAGGTTVLKRASVNKAPLDRSAVLNLGTPEGFATEISLTFDFSVLPQIEGWPTAKTGTGSDPHKDGGNPHVYPLDGADYTFILADCDGASTQDVFWAGSTASRPHSVLFLASQYRYFGFPSLADYKLVQVKCENFRYSKSTAPQMGIVNSILGNKVNPYDGEHEDVIVHDLQTWGENGEIQTYDLEGTEKDTVYYLYSKAAGGIISLTLTYTK